MQDRSIEIGMTSHSLRSGWMLPDGLIFSKRGRHQHTDLLHGPEYGQVEAFNDGSVRLCMDPRGELCLQWAGVMTAAQRREVLSIMVTATMLRVSSSKDGYDPEIEYEEEERKFVIEERTIQPSDKRGVQRAIRLDMGEAREY
jgi:hypothetical protein